MQDWLEKTSHLEKPILESSGRQVRQVIDDLLPQIRLTAAENDGVALVEIKVGFEFDEEPGKVGIFTEGSVAFPPKRAYAEDVCE